jgi:eukaryotic-like serine/threonine-protein kinase
MAEELPILIAAVANEQALALEEAARVGRHVWVELKWPPAEAGPHLLEVYTPAKREPLRLLAEPLGTSGEKGFALRIYPWEDAQVETAADVDLSADQLVGSSLAGGRFDILSLIGEGSIGAVYRARHTGLGITVAVKVLHEAFQRDVEFCRRFYDEALALSRLDHTNLVHIYDYGQEPDGMLYIAMAFVDGMTLRAMMTKEKRALEMKRVVSVMLQVSAGLGHAHARGLLHRDVKPDNVMIVSKENDDGFIVENVKVLDFGFAVPPSVTADVAQRLAGTPVYMSPEQCLGQELDARSDVYACGVMLYELMTGTVPFMARSAQGIREMQVKAPPPLIAAKRADVDPRMDRLVQKALSKRREDRHPSMQELRAELKLLLAPASAAQGTFPNNPRTTGAFERRSVPSLPSIPMPGRAGSIPSPPPSSPISSSRPSSPSRPPALDRTRVEAVADALASDPAAWLGTLTKEREPAAFTARFNELDAAVRALALRSDVRTLKMVAAVVSALEGRLDKLAAGNEATHVAIAAVARTFDDPEVLGPIARRLLEVEDGRPIAADLIRAANVAGAYALYGARAKMSVDPPARIAFVTTMKSLGESALPVVRAALERIFDSAFSGQHRVAVDLAEDLLLSIPASPDEMAGHLVVKYAASPIPNLCRAAARALPRVWVARARPTLLDLIGHSDDGVRIAAIVGLKEIDGIDEDAVTRIAALFDDESPPVSQLRAAAIGCLKSAQQSARARAEEALERIGA